MRRFSVSIVLVLTAGSFIALAPDAAQAGWRRGCGGAYNAWGYPGWGYGYGGYGYYGYGYDGYGAYMPGYYVAPPPPPPPVAVAAAPRPDVVNVAIHDDQIEPATLTVDVGTTVRLKNGDEHAHTFTSSTGVWDSEELQPGQGVRITFLRPGVYEYFCADHRQMRGKVVVR
ncbi:MAG TPA: cupredoxin domain-containing protein [Pirellulales bacterium]|nr:cupredoxin domain-containing protein [Pirellulales bacterium]